MLTKATFRRAVFGLGLVVLFALVLNPINLKGGGSSVAFAVGSLLAIVGVITQIILRKTGYLDEEWRFAFLPYWLALWIVIGLGVALVAIRVL